jgi:hypothetical protein
MLKKKYILIIIFLGNFYNCFAQGPGTDCDNPDPFDPCPLDTWVIVLVLIALAFTVFHLRKKQKSLQA